MQAFATMRRHIFNWLLASLGFLVTVVFVAKVLPAHVSPLERSEAAMLGRRSQCNVLFIGPSYVKRLLPAYFDAASKRLGKHDRACKLARSAMRGVELEHELERLLARRWPKLELVVVDVTLGDSVAFEPENWFTHRVIGWHTIDSLKELGRYYDFRDGWINGLITHGSLLWAHARHVAANYLEVGKGAAWVGELSTYEEPVATRKHPKRNYSRDLHDLLQTNEFNQAHRVFGDSKWPISLRERIRGHGYEAAFLFSPVWEPTRLPRRAVTGEDPLKVMDFANPTKYRKLYRKRARGVTSHLKVHVGPQFFTGIGKGCRRARVQSQTQEDHSGKQKQAQAHAREQTKGQSRS